MGCWEVPIYGLEGWALETDRSLYARWGIILWCQELRMRTPIRKDNPYGILTSFVV